MFHQSHKKKSFVEQICKQNTNLDALNTCMIKTPSGEIWYRIEPSPCTPAGLGYGGNDWHSALAMGKLVQNGYKINSKDTNVFCDNKPNIDSPVIPEQLNNNPIDVTSPDVLPSVDMKNAFSSLPNSEIIYGNSRNARRRHNKRQRLEQQNNEMLSTFQNTSETPSIIDNAITTNINKEVDPELLGKNPVRKSNSARRRENKKLKNKVSVN